MGELRVHNFSISVDGFGAGATHHARPPVAMAGGTTFFFVTEGIEAALDGWDCVEFTPTAGAAHVRLRRTSSR